MKLADKYLYYPFIQIPESTLVHSLLFKDRIKRIIPPHHEMDQYHLNRARLPNDICRQYLGYEFIESADYWDAKEKIAKPFCHFLEEAYTTNNPQHFESLLGPDYKKTLSFAGVHISGGTQYFVYAHKFSEQVFNKLDSLKWMRYEESLNACELRDELCNVYMSLLAACISKLTGEPISTGVKESEDILRAGIFREYFGDIVPAQMYAENNSNHELCINLLLGGEINASHTYPQRIPIHEVLTFEEAARIRCGLENERRDFCSLVDDIIDKTKTVDLKDPQGFISLEVKDALESAHDYLNRIKAEAAREIKDARKDLIINIQTGLSLAFPALGIAADTLIGSAPAPGVWSAGGTVLGVGTFFLPRFFRANGAQNIEEMRTSRQRAYIFMNRLWTIQNNI